MKKPLISLLVLGLVCIAPAVPAQSSAAAKVKTGLVHVHAIRALKALSSLQGDNAEPVPIPGGDFINLRRGDPRLQAREEAPPSVDFSSDRNYNRYW